MDGPGERSRGDVGGDAWESTLGHVLVEVRRVHYVRAGEVISERGPLELTFDDGSVVLADCGGDGETLVLGTGPWADPFEEPLSEENARYVAAAGRWTVSALERADPLGQLIGQTVQSLTPTHDARGVLTGMRVHLGGATLSLRTGADELLVAVEQP